MTDQTAELVRDFVAETREHLARIEPDLLAMERQGEGVPSEVVHRVFRAIHSTKGGASFLAFEALKRLSHSMESVLARIRDGKLLVTPKSIDALLRGVDVLRAMVDDIEHSDEIPHAAELAALADLLDGDDVTGTGVAPPTTLPLPELAGFDVSMADLATCLGRGMQLYQVEIPDDRAAELTVETVRDRIEAIGHHLAYRSPSGNEAGRQHVCATVLDADLLAAELDLLSNLVRPLAADEIRARLRALQREPTAAQWVSKTTGSSPMSPAEPSRPDGSADETLRVRLDLLDRLMNSAGELVLGRNQLLRSLENIADGVPGLLTVLQHIDRITTELQDDIMQTRMQPIGLLFARFPRVARDQSLLLGKQVDVEMVGEGVEVDKSIIEALADPLTHLVRNSIGHGIEPPEERRATGKSPRGRLTLHAFHENGQVTVLVSDDGRGMNSRLILERALATGLIDQRAANALRPQDIIDLAFAAGFSTRSTVSDLAGRGVGLDVVRTNVERLGGQVELATEEGVGTSVILRLPLTLAIIPSLIVGAGGARFAVPQASIVELVWVQAEQIADRIEMIQGAAVLRLRGRLLPLVRLGDVLDMSQRFVDPESRELTVERRERIADRRASVRRDTEEERSGRREAPASDYNIVVLRAGSNRFGLIVNELFESEEIVVKPLPAYIKHLDCFAGTTILGDGSVTMILEPSTIATRAHLEFATVSQEEHRRHADTARKDTRIERRRSVILFEVAPDERFAVPQEQVLRVERITLDSVKQLGGGEYVQHRGTGLPVLRLDSVLPVSRVPSDTEEAFLLVPRPTSPDAQAIAPGLLVWRIVDALEVLADFQPPLFEGPGLLGSAVVDGHMTTLVDPAQVIAAAQPRGAS